MHRSRTGRKILTIFEPLLRLVASLGDKGRWRSSGAFDSEWKTRIATMAELVRNERTVLDVGCGQMWLREYLKPGQIYIGSDMHPRDDSTIVCDYNAGEFPTVSADVVFASGIIEYMKDPRWFIESAGKLAPRVVISYVPKLDDADRPSRTMQGYKNHLTRAEFAELAGDAGFEVEFITSVGNNLIYNLTRKGSA